MITNISKDDTRRKEITTREEMRRLAENRIACRIAAIEERQTVSEMMRAITDTTWRLFTKLLSVAMFRKRTFGVSTVTKS